MFRYLFFFMDWGGLFTLPIFFTPLFLLLWIIILKRVDLISDHSAPKLEMSALLYTLIIDSFWHYPKSRLELAQVFDQKFIDLAVMVASAVDPDDLLKLAVHGNSLPRVDYLMMCWQIKLMFSFDEKNSRFRCRCCCCLMCWLFLSTWSVWKKKVCSLELSLIWCIHTWVCMHNSKQNSISHCHR